MVPWPLARQELGSALAALVLLVAVLCPSGRSAYSLRFGLTEPGTDPLVDQTRVARASLAALHAHSPSTIPSPRQARLRRLHRQLVSQLPGQRAPHPPSRRRRAAPPRLRRRPAPRRLDQPGPGHHPDPRRPRPQRSPHLCPLSRRPRRPSARPPRSPYPWHRSRRSGSAAQAPAADCSGKNGIGACEGAGPPPPTSNQRHPRGRPLPVITVLTCRTRIRRTVDPSDVKGANNYVSDALTAAMAGRPVQVAYTRSYGCSVKYQGVD